MRKLLVALLCLTAILLFAGFQQTQIKIDVEAVNVFVTVIDKDGRFVTDVTADRFILYEDGYPQEITNFSRETDLPLRLGLLIDTSSSVRMKLDFEKDAAVNFVRSVMRREDQALLVEFDNGVTLRHDFTSKPTSIINEIKKLRAGGGTALWDAVFSTSVEKMTERDSRKALIIVSDGEDLNSKRSPEETLEAVQAQEVTIYTIGTSRFGASSSPAGEKLLKGLAEESGGRAFFPYSADKLEGAFDQIDQELRSQYSMTYTPRNTAQNGEFRKIEVRIKDGKDLTLRHRQGYRLPKRFLK